MLGEHLEQDAEYVERFVREAQSAAALSHPNIVQIYSISEEGGHHYFVMEYVHGTSVQRMIQTKGKLAPADAARLILQAAAGLQDAHAQNVIHRDIKPANLMVTDRGLVKIADFGLALMGAATTRLTATGMLMGTPGYLSPEQCLDQSPDHRTDIYSLGVTFFEMVTGTMPFRADSPLALLKLIVEVEPPDIRELNPEVDDELRSIIARMLAKDRDERYSSCTEVIADIQGLARGKRRTAAGRPGDDRKRRSSRRHASPTSTDSQRGHQHATHRSRSQWIDEPRFSIRRARGCHRARTPRDRPFHPTAGDSGAIPDRLDPGRHRGFCPRRRCDCGGADRQERGSRSDLQPQQRPGRGTRAVARSSR